jgi:DNA-binding MarR family transcriptional regulator
MATSGTLTTQQHIQQDTQRGVAYFIAAHGVLQQQSKRTKCPVALLHTLLALEAMNSASYYLNARTTQLQQVMQISLPLLRSYVRELESRKYLERVRFFRRGPLLLKLTAEGKSLVASCRREMRHSATQVLEWVKWVE